MGDMALFGKYNKTPIRTRKKKEWKRVSLVLGSTLLGFCIGSYFLSYMTSTSRRCRRSLNGGFVTQGSSLRPLESSENVLFVGIMTARKYLDTRAMASHRTWVPRIPGKVVYFLGEGEQYTGELNVVQLKGISENDYPPQKKSFAMVEYISHHYADHYEWIIRADDDVFVKVDELVRFLKSVSSDVPRYIGQPGFGKSVEEGKLGLSGAFCMGGPGVIMTRPLVKAVAPALKGCLNYTATGHEDTELGRCITLTTGMKQLFYQNYQELDMPNSSFKKVLGADEETALTLHPLKEPSYVFRLDSFLVEKSIAKLRKKTRALLAEVSQLERSLRGRWGGSDPRLAKVMTSVGLPELAQEFVLNDASAKTTEACLVCKERVLPSERPEPPVLHRETQGWDFLRYRQVYSSHFVMGKLVMSTRLNRRADLHNDLTASAMKLREVKTSLGPEPSALMMNFTYMHLTPGLGVQEMMFINLWTQQGKQVLPLLAMRPFHHQLVDFREEGDDVPDHQGLTAPTPVTTAMPTIHVLMPLYRRSSTYRQFLNMYQRTLQDYLGKVVLHLVVFIDPEGEYRLLSSMTHALMNKNPDLHIKFRYRHQAFNRGLGLMLAMSKVKYDELLLFMDVDMEFTADFLHRVIKNTVKGKRAYFPIYFVHFNQETICYKQTNCDLLLLTWRDEVGLWRSFSYGIGSIYKYDLVKAGGFKVNIVGWGLEDVDFYEKCLASGIDIIRTAEPSMIHRYHSRECNTSLPEVQLKQCQDSGAAMMGSVRTLYRILDEMTAGNGV